MPWDLVESRIGDGVRSEYRIIDWSSSPGAGTHLVNTMPWNNNMNGLTADYRLGLSVTHDAGLGPRNAYSHKERRCSQHRMN
jgi:hypothetical protein